MARKLKRHTRPAPPPVDKIKLAIAYVGAVDLLRRQWESLYYLFIGDQITHRWIKTAIPALADSVGLSLTVMVYLEIAKLHDPATSMNRPDKRNLVLRRVIDELAPPTGTPARSRIEDEYLKLQPTAAKIKDWRNSVGAHKDLLMSLRVMDHLLNRSQPHPLPFIPLFELQSAVNSIFEITDLIVATYLPDMSWRDTELVKNDAAKIVGWIARSQSDQGGAQ
jgi:hypothetical protein